MPKRQRTLSSLDYIQKKKRESYEKILQELSNGSLLPSEMGKLSDTFQRRMNSGIDIGYLKTVLFPEQYSYDIPFPLTSVSFCKFTDKQEISISTGPSGSGMMIWYPRTTCGPQLFVYTSAPTAAGHSLAPVGYAAATGSPATPTAWTNTTGWMIGPHVKANNYFNQTALVAGAMTLQYVGKVEDESGLMVGGHLYGLSPTNITTDEIENSQWVTRARPGEGLRFVHLPRDSTDFEFYQTAGLGGANSTWASTNEGANKVNSQNITTLDFSGVLKSDNSGSGSNTWFGTSIDASNSNSYVKATPPNVSSVTYNNNANCIAIYWTGMTANQNWLRVDIARKFDGIPQAQYRDIMELTRPVRNFDEKKTFNVLNALCQTAPIGGHTLKEIDRIVDRISGHLPNVGYLMDNGGLKQVNTMAELADILEHPNEEEKGLTGQATGEIGRAYHYF